MLSDKLKGKRLRAHMYINIITLNDKLHQEFRTNGQNNVILAPLYTIARFISNLPAEIEVVS